MTTKPECYGSMFPRLISLTHNQPVAGKVFGYQIEQPGIAVRSRTVTTDREAWEDCLACPDFDSCYRLSVGKALMEIALKP